MMLIMFSFAYWPFSDLIEELSVQVIGPFLKWVSLSFSFLFITFAFGVRFKNHHQSHAKELTTHAVF